MNTHHHDIATASAPQPPDSLAHLFRQAARLVLSRLLGPTRQAERRQLRAAADALVGMTGA